MGLVAGRQAALPLLRTHRSARDGSMIDVTATLTMVVLWCSAVLGLAAVFGLLYAVTAKPKLDRIEAHLERINGSIGRMSEWERQHEIDHARAERT